MVKAEAFPCPEGQRKEQGQRPLFDGAKRLAISPPTTAFSGRGMSRAPSLHASAEHHPHANLRRASWGCRFRMTEPQQVTIDGTTPRQAVSHDDAGRI